MYAIESDARDDLHQALTAAGIQTGIHYPTPVHLMDPYRDPAFPEGSFPVAERVAGRVLSLPIDPELSEASVQEVARAVRMSRIATAGKA